MSVVPYPIAIVPQAIEPVFMANTKVNRSIFTRAVTTLERRGAHHGWRISYRNLSAANAARIETALKSLRGMANRCYLPMYGYTRRGSGFGSELLSNGNFANGSTGWAAAGPNATVSAADYLLRVTRAGNANTTDVVIVSGGAASTVTQYAPYAARSIDHQGLATTWSFGPQLGSAVGGEEYGRANATTFGLKTLAVVIPATTAHFGLVDYDTGLNMARDYINVSFVSLARCALVDNGSNLLLQSDEFDTTWTTSNATVDDQALEGPDGETNADYLREDGTAATTHFVHQSVTVSSAVADYSFGVLLKAANRTWAAMQIFEATGGTNCTAFFNLSAGVPGDSAVAGNWSNIRTFTVNYGNGWIYCCVVARKTNAATSLQARIYAAENNGDADFNGLTQNSIGMFRATLAQSSAPTRPIATTTTATSGTSQTGGAIHLKGLPASTNGILVAGDQVQIVQPNGSQIVTAATALNSDAAGLGYFQFNGQLFESPADNAAVIDVTPMARCLLDQDSVSFPKRPGVFTDVDFTLVEDIQRA